MHFRLAVPLGFASLALAVSNPSSQKVTSSAAFSSGAGNNNNNANIYDGTGNAGSDTYKCYQDGWQNFPPNCPKNAMAGSCSNLGIGGSCSNGAGAFGAGNSGEQTGLIWNAIQQVAQTSLVDHRFILATILQESIGCVNVCPTTNPDPSQPDNPGLMQSDCGVTFVGNSASDSSQQSSITQIAARCYNSGSVDSGNLNDGEGATNSYVNDIANRMTGWLYSDSKFNQC
ncbi:hypothetical protein ACQKWADRAFT_322215 [Trichoderma austrokoningii]